MLFGPDLDGLLQSVFGGVDTSSKTTLYNQSNKLIRILYDGFKLDSRIAASKIQAAYKARHPTRGGGTSSGLLLPLASCKSTYMPKVILCRETNSADPLQGP